MASRKELVEKRRQQLLNKGYPKGVINMALEWAQNSAAGMATYVHQIDASDDEDREAEKLTVKFLPRYLKDTEKYIQSFGFRPSR